MTGEIVLAAAAVVALVDWWSVFAGRLPVERIAKPLTMSLLVVVAATYGDLPADVRSLLVIGALFGVIGDVALLSGGEMPFLVGLSSFAAGHLAYAGAGLAVGFDLASSIPGVAVMVALLGFRFVTRIVEGARSAGGAVLAGAVLFYAAVIGAMVVTTWGTGSSMAAIGATAFAVSDWVLGHQRFAGPLPGGRLAVMMPYHVGQALLIVGIATAG